MKSYHLTFSAKNKTSLNYNFKFFKNSLLNSNTIKKHFQKRTKKQFLTILKSPHVNKSAQEQFESHIFSRQLSIFSPKNLKQIYVVKKIKNNLFSDLRVKIKCSANKNNKNKLRLQTFNPDNFKLNTTKKFVISQKQSLTDLKKRQHFNLFKTLTQKKLGVFLKTLDVYGELVFKIV